MRFQGWLLDPYIKGRHAVHWFKTVNGEMIALRERHRPQFIADPAETNRPEDLVYLFGEHPFVTKAKVVEKYTDLSRETLKRVVEVTVEQADDLRDVIRYAERIKEVQEVYNTGLIPIQWHLIHRQLPPSSFCEVEGRNGELVDVEVLDDWGEVEPPPFNPVTFITSDSRRIEEVKIMDGDKNLIVHLKGPEAQVLDEFQQFLKIRDPDILVTDSPIRTVKKVVTRARRHGISFQFGRGDERYRGRVLLGMSPFLDSGVAGIVERARFTFAPMGVSADWEAGKTIDSRQCYEAANLGVMVPKMKGGFSFSSSAWDLVKRDRGGMVFSPQVGLHENVAALDFESMFPNIIVHRNVSYETIAEDGVRDDIEGFMGCFTKEFLRRRLHFKHLRNQMPLGSREWWICQRRQSALKLMLVVVYGYSGCYANRFANVHVFQEINRQARHAMVQALNISLENGFEVVYGDTDSLFMKRHDASKEDYGELAREITEATGLPMGVDRHFRYLALLSKTTDPTMQASRRYYGKLTDGNLFYRGIELRRHDTPPLIKEMQTRMMETLFDAETGAEVLRDQVPRALEIADKTCRMVQKGKARAEDLVISKRLRRDLHEYQSLQPHIVAAMLGKELEENSNFIFVNTERKNPYMRVMPAQMLNGTHKAYDKRKYFELTRRAAWNLLRPFVPDEETIGGEKLRLSRLDMYS